MFNNIYVVYHCYISDKYLWEKILPEQLTDFKNTGLSEISEVHTTIISTEEQFQTITNNFKQIIPNIIVHGFRENTYEYPGIHLVWELANKHPEAIILYFHSKGVTHVYNHRFKSECILMQEVIKPWKKILDVFNTTPEVNKIGFASSDAGFMWFNFWWARAQYLITCEEPIVNPNRYYYEDWLSRTSKPAEPKYKDTYNLCNKYGPIDSYMAARLVNRVKLYRPRVIRPDSRVLKSIVSPGSEKNTPVGVSENMLPSLHKSKITLNPNCNNSVR